MAAPRTPPAGPNGNSNGPRRPRAWLARRMAAVLSVAAMLSLGGLMYWNDQQGTANAAQAATTSSANQTTSQSSSNRSDRERGEGGDGEGEHESEGDDGGSIVDDIAGLIPGLSGNSNSSSTTSNSGSQQQSAPTPHTNTRGS